MKVQQGETEEPIITTREILNLKNPNSIPIPYIDGSSISTLKVEIPLASIADASGSDKDTANQNPTSNTSAVVEYTANQPDANDSNALSEKSKSMILLILKILIILILGVQIFQSYKTYIEYYDIFEFRERFMISFIFQIIFIILTIIALISSCFRRCNIIFYNGLIISSCVIFIISGTAFYYNIEPPIYPPKKNLTSLNSTRNISLQQ